MIYAAKWARLRNPPLLIRGALSSRGDDSARRPAGVQGAGGKSPAWLGEFFFFFRARLYDIPWRGRGGKPCCLWSTGGIRGSPRAKGFLVGLDGAGESGKRGGVAACLRLPGIAEAEPKMSRPIPHDQDEGPPL